MLAQVGYGSGCRGSGSRLVALLGSAFGAGDRGDRGVGPTKECIALHHCPLSTDRLPYSILSPPAASPFFLFSAQI